MDDPGAGSPHRPRHLVGSQAAAEHPRGRLRVRPSSAESRWSSSASSPSARARATACPRPRAPLRRSSGSGCAGTGSPAKPKTVVDLSPGASDRLVAEPPARAIGECVGIDLPEPVERSGDGVRQARQIPGAASAPGSWTSSGTSPTPWRRRAARSPSPRSGRTAGSRTGSAARTDQPLASARRPPPWDARRENAPRPPAPARRARSSSAPRELAVPDEVERQLPLVAEPSRWPRAGTRGPSSRSASPP